MKTVEQVLNLIAGVTTVDQVIEIKEMLKNMDNDEGDLSAILNIKVLDLVAKDNPHSVRLAKAALS